jgi:hypothetical protein
MLSPGSKGWIKKYFALVNKGEISLDITPYKEEKQHLKHLIYARSGIIYGYPSSFIFAKNIKKDKWTIDEKLTFLLFECHLFAYVSTKGNQIVFEDFSNSLLDFYEHHSVRSISSLFTFFLKEANDAKLENILEKRTEIKKNLLENTLWVNYLSNTFVYLDVILFDEFLRTKRTLEVSNYELYAEEALKTLILAAQADGIVEQKEKKMFELFSVSAKIGEKKKDKIVELFEFANDFSILSKQIYGNDLYKRYLLNVSVLTIYANHEAGIQEKNYLKAFSEFLNLDEAALNETLVLVENFVLKHNDEIAFLTNTNSIEKLYDNVSKRWIKILGRNKDKLAIELKQSKELVSLIKKSTTTELSKEEKEKVKTQFLDIVKSMPALAIFMLPGGALLLPLVLKIIPTLIPSAFRENEID